MVSLDNRGHLLRIHDRYMCMDQLHKTWYLKIQDKYSICCREFMAGIYGGYPVMIVLVHFFVQKKKNLLEDCTTALHVPHVQGQTA